MEKQLCIVVESINIVYLMNLNAIHFSRLSQQKRRKALILEQQANRKKYVSQLVKQTPYNTTRPKMFETKNLALQPIG